MYRNPKNHITRVDMRCPCVGGLKVGRTICARSPHERGQADITSIARSGQRGNGVNIGAIPKRWLLIGMSQKCHVVQCVVGRA